MIKLFVVYVNSKPIVAFPDINLNYFKSAEYKIVEGVFNPIVTEQDDSADPQKSGHKCARCEKIHALWEDERQCCTGG